MKTRVVFVIVIIILMASIEEFAKAQTVSSVTVKVSPDNTTVACSFTVSVPQGGTTIKDVHIDPPKRMKFDRPPCPVNVNSPSGWGENFSSERYSMWSGGHAGISQNQSHTFELNLNKGNNDVLDFRQCTWTLTTNGEIKWKTGDVHSTDNVGADGNNFVLPVKYINAGVDPGSSSCIGGEVIVDLATSEIGYAYQVFFSTTLLLPDVQDINGQAIEIDTANPPPRNWGLVIRRQRGAFEMDNGTAQCEILIPYRPEIVGEIFYAVGAIDLDSDGVFDIYTEPERIEIKNG